MASVSRSTVSHSLSSSSCQAIRTMRPPGRSARRRLLNAATLSSKNIAPALLMMTSKLSGPKSWTCASPCTKLTLVNPAAALRALVLVSSCGPDVAVETVPRLAHVGVRFGHAMNLVRTARTDDRSATDYPSADPQAPRSFNQEPRVLKSISSPCLSVRGHVRTSRLLCAGALPFLRRAYEFLCGASSNNSVYQT